MSNRRLIRNPITGEEVDYSARCVQNTSRQELTNESPIPKLNFKDLDYETGSNRPSSRHGQQNPLVVNQNKESARLKSAYDYFSKRPLQSPIISLENEQKESARNVTSVQSNQESQLEAPRVVKPSKPKFNDPTRMITIEDIQKLWLNDTNSNREVLFDKHKSLKENLVIDTVLTDQLSRPVISEAIQTSRPSNRPQSSNGNRAVLTENTLNNRVKFNCRVKTPNGKNALRELFGILFAHDGSLTIYEFRQMCGSVFTGIGSGNFSKKANALPFIQRKIYSHNFGRRIHKIIDVSDIFKGSILHLPFDNGDMIELEITDVDENEKNKMIENFTKKLNNTESEKFLNNILNPYLAAELDDLRIISDIRNKVRRQIENRSITIYIDIGKTLRKVAQKPKMTVNLTQFESILNTLNIKLTQEDLKQGWNKLDLNEDGYISYYKVVRGFMGEMNVIRHTIFRELMHKLDTIKSGYVKLSDIQKFLKIRQHPLIKANTISEKEFLDTFLNLFEIQSLESAFNFQAEYGSQFVSYEQFEEFYNGLSIVIDSDIDFINILKNSWSSL